MPIVKAVYVSVWDGDTTIYTVCEWDADHLTATNIATVDVDGLDMLEREYVVLDDNQGGIEIDVDSTRENEYGIPAVDITQALHEWEAVDYIHNLIREREEKFMPQICNYLTLVCLGTYAGWAASFDFNPAPDWYEHEGIEEHPFAAQAETKEAAIEAAAQLVHDRLYPEKE